MSNIRYNIKKYLKSCFLLTIPVMAWNIFLTHKLPPPFQPAIFQSNIPTFIAMGEQISRMLIFALTLIMPLSVISATQKKGIIVYAAGIALYFSSWIALIYYPQSRWSNSCWGFLAPAYTPALWLTGIGLAGDKLYFNLPYRRWIFISVSVIFLIFHNTHTLLIYNRIQPQTGEQFITHNS